LLDKFILYVETGESNVQVKRELTKKCKKNENEPMSHDVLLTHHGMFTDRKDCNE
jgi:hypothetical protein